MEQNLYLMHCQCGFFSIKNLITEYIARYAKNVIPRYFLPDFIRINVSTKNAMKSNKLSYRNVG